MNKLIDRNIISGVSQPFEIDDQVTVFAYGLQAGQQVAFYLVALSDPLKAECSCPPGQVVPPTVVDEMDFNCCGQQVVLTREQPWVVLDAPQRTKIRVKLETTGGAIVVPTDQVVWSKVTNTKNVNDRMRGCACTGEA